MADQGNSQPQCECPCQRLAEAEAVLQQYQQERVQYLATEEQMAKMIEHLKADNHGLLVDLHHAQSRAARHAGR